MKTNTLESLRVRRNGHGTPSEFATQLAGPDAIDLVVEMAHDLRSPLTSILFLAEALHDGQSGPLNEKQRRQLAIIYSAALGLCSAASDVIELARGGEQLADDAAAPFSVSAVLESVRDIVRPVAEERGLPILLQPPRADLRRGYPRALRRVLLNLVTNALKFTDQGYVELAAREGRGTRVEFSVRDTGPGMDPRMLRTLSVPLRRATAGSRHQFSCSGLGIAICQRLVRAMGGELDVESQPGRGSRFHFTLELPSAGDGEARAPDRQRDAPLAVAL